VFRDRVRNPELREKCGCSSNRKVDADAGWDKSQYQQDYRDRPHEQRGTRLSAGTAGAGLRGDRRVDVETGEKPGIK